MHFANAFSNQTEPNILSESVILRGAVIGAGYFSQFHYDAWKRIEDVEILACCDLEIEKAQSNAEQHGIARAFDDVEKMLSSESELDFIDVVTGPATHRPIVEQILAHQDSHPNLTIICQKPLAPTFGESIELVKIAQEAGVPLVVHENFRFQPWYRQIKTLLSEGVIGNKLHTISLRHRAGDGWGERAYLNRQAYFRTMPRMLVFETGVHTVDTFRYLIGDIDRTFAHMRRLNEVIVGEDTALAMFEFSGGGIGVYDANRYNECGDEDSRYTFGELLIEFDGGSIRSDLKGQITVQPLGEPVARHDYQPSTAGFAGDCVYAAQSHYVDVMRKRANRSNTTAAFETDARSYLKTLAIQEAMYRSAESGRWEPSEPFSI